MDFEKIESVGNIPLPRFGHTTTALGKSRIILYGGATGNTGQFSITDNTYLLDIPSKLWKKVETTGIAPSPRAAHASIAISNNEMIVYGGATGSGGLASEELFLLELRETSGVWKVIETVGKGPGKRYGHTLSFANPFLVVFGGNTGEKSVADCWVLNIEKQPISWVEIKTSAERCPPARVYHSAALCTSGTAAGMIVVFGGRASDQQALNDSWGLRRHRDGKWDWVKAPYQQQPSARYQHSVLFIGSIMVVIGGRTNNVSQNLPLQAYDIQTSNWYKFSGPQRFRNGTWLIDTYLYIYGGFQLVTPNTPTDSMIRVNLVNIFASKPYLKEKIVKFQAPSTDTKPVTPKMADRKTLESAIVVKPQNKPLSSERTPMGKDTKMGVFEPKKGLSSREDLPVMFLNQLCQPDLYQNIEAIKFTFKPVQIVALIEMAKEVIMDQPILLKVKAPLKIFGDIHGQLSDLLSFFRLYGSPFDKGKKGDVENFDYIFLGDFVDRGSHSLQTICLLLALKALYPKTIHLIRGNHQDHQINCTFGFIEECISKCREEPSEPNSVFNNMNRLFEWLPLAAVVEDKILCLHGGIGSAVKTLQDITKIKRPIEISHEVTNNEQQVILDILWSDPTESDAEMGIVPNVMRDPHETGNIIKFGPDIVHDFLKRTGLSMVIRGHECVMDGFQRFAGGSLITVFSATDYCRRHKNAGAILILKTNLEIIPKLIYPWNGNGNNWMDDQEDLRRRPPTPPRWRRQNNLKN